jgi:hypothetical protein
MRRIVLHVRHAGIKNPNADNLRILSNRGQTCQNSWTFCREKCGIVYYTNHLATDSASLVAIGRTTDGNRSLRITNRAKQAMLSDVNDSDRRHPLIKSARESIAARGG